MGKILPRQNELLLKIGTKIMQYADNPYKSYKITERMTLEKTELISSPPYLCLLFLELGTCI